MIRELQQTLSDIYQVSPAYDVRDFLITDPTLAASLGRGAMLANSEETLFMMQDDEGLALSLFLDPELLGRLEAANPMHDLRPEQLDGLWKVLEGISHFVYVAWKAVQNRTVSLLELELQGEIDKFVGTMQLALDQNDRDLQNRLHGWLFDDVSFHSDLDQAALQRYRTANDYAARYCRGLGRRLLDGDAQVLSELRHFYRLQFADKISHTRSSIFAAA